MLLLLIVFSFGVRTDGVQASLSMCFVMYTALLAGGVPTGGYFYWI